MRLTDLAIRSLPAPEKGQKTYFDDAMKGFGIRVSQGGSKSFVVMYGPQRRLKTLARFPDTSLKDAKIAARGFFVADKPSPSKLTVMAATEAFLAHCERKNSPRTTADYKRLLNRHLPTGKLNAITKAGLLERLNRLADVPAEQRHAATAIGVFLNWCVAAGHLQTNPILGVRGIGHIKKRDRVLTADELKTVLQASLAYPFPFGPIVTLCITTGLRRSEVGHLHRSYIDGGIHLPPEITKNGLAHHFPIGPLTEHVIAAIPTTGDILFPGRQEGYWQGWSKAKKDFDPLSQPWTLHDLRRTFASVHAALGTPIHVIEKLLNHVSGSFAGVAGIYNRWTYWPEMTEAITRYEAHLQSLLKD